MHLHRLLRLAAFAGMSVTAACSAVAGTAATKRSACFPSPLHVTPGHVRAGSTVTLSSGSFACAARYPAGSHYRVVLGQIGRGPVLQLGRIPVNSDGSFAAHIKIPSSAKVGQAYVIVRGSHFDRPCHDTSGSCADYAVPLAIR